MQELVRSNDPVLLSFVRSLLEEEGIDHLALDGHMSVLEGSLGVLQQRILVPDEVAGRARMLLAANGLSAQIRPQRPAG